MNFVLLINLTKLIILKSKLKIEDQVLLDQLLQIPLDDDPILHGVIQRLVGQIDFI